jgi:hypothetical protein
MFERAASKSSVTRDTRAPAGVAIWARRKGYQGIEFLGAQGGSTTYTNFIIFEQSVADSAIKGSVTIIPW